MERLEITSRIKDKYFLENCVGIVDGTNLILALRPEDCSKEYFTRKDNIQFLADNKFIRNACMVGLVVYIANELCVTLRLFAIIMTFLHSEYMPLLPLHINSMIMITAYKCEFGQSVPIKVYISIIIILWNINVKTPDEDEQTMKIMIQILRMNLLF